MAVQGVDDNNDDNASSKGNGLLLYYYYHSFYSQKVLMALHEKKLSFKTQHVNLPKLEQYEPWFLKLNPRGEVPILQDGIKIIPDSQRIIEYLEDNFSNGNARLIPLDRDEIRRNVIDFSDMFSQQSIDLIVRGSLVHSEYVHEPKPPFVGPYRKMLRDFVIEGTVSVLRERAAANPEFQTVLLQRIAEQESTQNLVLRKEEYARVLENVAVALDKVEETLAMYEPGSASWLCCESFTVADISLSLLLHWLKIAGLSQYLFEDGKHPRVEAYLRRVQSRPSFVKSVPPPRSLLWDVVKLKLPFLLSLGVGVILGIFFYVRRWWK